MQKEKRFVADGAFQLRSYGGYKIILHYSTTEHPTSFVFYTQLFRYRAIAAHENACRVKCASFVASHCLGETCLTAADCPNHCEASLRKLQLHREPLPLPYIACLRYTSTYRSFSGALGAGPAIWFTFSIYFHGSSNTCLLYTSPSPRDATLSRMPSSA